jgi:outer membrane protein, multidrug efflux system
MTKSWPGWISAALLSGCASIPPIGLMPSDVPNEWTALPPNDVQEWPETLWWRSFRSPELNALIQSAQDQNLEIEIAVERLAQAEAIARAAGAALSPELTLTSGIAKSGTLGSGDSANKVNLGFSGFYQADFWNRNRSVLNAAQASAKASAYDREAVTLTVTASVAAVYFQLLSSRHRISIAANNLRVAREVLSIVEARVSSGASAPFALAQQRASVAGQDAVLFALQNQERTNLGTLAVLLGKPVQGFQVSGRTLAGLAMPEVRPGLPSDLLLRRPDIRRAEALLAAAHANTEAARAALYPSISLSGSLGASSSALSSLLSSGNIAFAIGASLVETIFDGGRRDADFDGALSRRREALLTYRRSVISAFTEVDVALYTVSRQADRSRAIGVQSAQAAEAYRIAAVRYRTGTDGFQTLLDAQRVLNDAQSQAAQATLDLLLARLELFIALGGGWRDEARLEVSPGI